MIKGVLIWTDDFKITKIKYDSEGNRYITNEPVDENFLNTLYLDEIYEDYLVKCVENAERFINGVSEFEKEELI